MRDKLEVARDEAKLLSEKVNHLDDLRFRARQMAATLSLALLGWGLAQKLWWLLLVASICPFLFWITEAVYRGYQQRCMCRLFAIEAYFRDVLSGKSSEVSDSFVVPDVFGKSMGAKLSVLRSFFRPVMILFYLPLALAALAGSFLM